MPDPYECFVRESKVSSSQEYMLQRIPGWEDKGQQATLSPSQVPLPLSRLCGASSSSSSSSDDEDNADERVPAFGLQRPLELASPDTQACQDDSYNPAFESDRERSLSPHADYNVYSSLWGSRLITQSQDVVGGMPHLAQVDMHDVQGIVHKSNGAAGLGHEGIPLKNQNNILAEQSNPSIAASKEHRVVRQKRLSEEYGQAIISEFAAFEEMEGHLRTTPARTVMPPKEHSGVDHETNNQSIGMIESGDRRFNGMDPMQVRHGNHVASVSDQAFLKRSGGVSPVRGHPLHPSLFDNKGPQQSSVATARLCSSHEFENLNKWKDKEVDHMLDISSQKRKLSKDADHAQENNKSTSDTNQPESNKLKASTFVGQERRHARGSTATKCGVPIEISTEDQTSKIGVTSVMDTNPKMNSADCIAFPKSVMDVVMLATGELPIPRDADPDFLSVVMNTGVSLSLPFRDCKGRLISAPRVDNI